MHDIYIERVKESLLLGWTFTFHYCVLWLCVASELEEKKKKKLAKNITAVSTFRPTDRTNEHIQFHISILIACHNSASSNTHSTPYPVHHTVNWHRENEDTESVEFFAFRRWHFITSCRGFVLLLLLLVLCCVFFFSLFFWLVNRIFAFSLTSFSQSHWNWVFFWVHEEGVCL